MVPQVIHGATSRPPAFPECLDGNIQADLVPVFETIRDGFGRGIYVHGYPFYLIFLYAGTECSLGEAHDTQWRVLHARPPGLFADGQPDFKWRLGREVMKTQGGQQTDHAFGWRIDQNSYSICILKVLSGAALDMPASQAALYLMAW